MFPIRICIFQICKIRIRQHQIEHSLFTITITKRLLEKYKKEVSYTFSDLGSGSVFFFSSLLNSQFSDHLIYQFSIINVFCKPLWSKGFFDAILRLFLYVFSTYIPIYIFVCIIQQLTFYFACTHCL